MIWCRNLVFEEIRPFQQAYVLLLRSGYIWPISITDVQREDGLFLNGEPDAERTSAKEIVVLAFASARCALEWRSSTRFPADCTSGIGSPFCRWIDLSLPSRGQHIKGRVVASIVGCASDAIDPAPVD